MDGRTSSRGESGKSLTEVLLAPLLVGIIAVALTAWFNGQQNERQNALEDRRAEEARNIEEQRAQDAALQAYLDQMSVLILEKDLHDLEGEEEQSLYDTPRGNVSYTKTSTLARARTLSTLDRVDPERKRTMVQFLYESALIGRVSPLEEDYSPVIVGLEGANLTDASLHNLNLGGVYLPFVDLSGADFSGAFLDRATLDHTNLSNANLSGALLQQTDLTQAILKGADLSDASLRGAALSEADLSGADLSGADLSGASGVTKESLEQEAETLRGATMPDGSMSTMDNSKHAEQVPAGSKGNRDNSKQAEGSDRIGRLGALAIFGAIVLFLLALVGHYSSGT